MRTLTFKIVSVLTLGLLVTAGLGCDIFLPEKGGAGQPCLDNDTCDEGLECRNNVCRAYCDAGNRCATEGQERCKPQVTVVQTCTPAGEGCLQWVDTLVCTQPEYCADLGGGDFGCTGGCTDECMSGDERCNGSVRQDCDPTADADQCFDWRDVEDCAASVPVEACNEVGDPPTTECSATCNSTCTQGTPNRCVTHLLLEACDPVDGFPSCTQWHDAICTQDDNCTPCDGAFDAVCNEVSGACECAIPCGAGGQVCCLPGETCYGEACGPACLDLAESCDSPGTPCCGNAACFGTCQECVGGQTACVDECCTPSQFCRPADHACVNCDPANDGPACGDKCCATNEVCNDRTTGLCIACDPESGEVPCERVCCVTSSNFFCLNPGSCASCPGGATVCNAVTPFKECCLPPAICNDGVGCCDPGCEGLPCGPGPNADCQPLCGDVNCSGVRWSLTLGGAIDERAGTNSPSVVLRPGALDAPWTLIRSESLDGLLLAGFNTDGSAVAKYTLAGAGPGAEAVLRNAPADNTLIIAGTESAWNAGSGFEGLNVWIVKLAAGAASVEWNKVYGTPADDAAYDLQPLPPSSPGYVVVGQSRDNNIDLTSGLAMRVALNGDLTTGIELRSPDESEDFVLLAVAPLVASGTLQRIVAVGLTAPRESGDSRPFAIGLDPALGSILWQVKLQSGPMGAARAVVADGTNSVVIAGEVANANDSNLFDMFALKLNATTGAIVWQRSYRLLGTDEWAASIARGPDNTLLVSGVIAYDAMHGNEEGWLLRISADDGHLLWQRRYGGPDGDQLSMAIARDIADPDGGYLAVGARDMPGHAKDLWLLRTDEAGWIPTCQTNTEAVFTPAGMDNPGFNTETTTAGLITLVLGTDCESADISTGFTYTTEATLSPVLDCP